MTKALVLQLKREVQHTHTYKHLTDNIDQYISANKILGIKLCLAAELTSEGSVRLWALLQSL